MICDNFRSSYDGIQFKVHQICSVFDYTTTTFRILICAGNKQLYPQVIHQPTKLEGLYKSKLQDSTQLQTALAQCNQQNFRSGGEPDYYRLRMCVNCTLIRLPGTRISRFKMKWWREKLFQRVTRKITLSLSGKWENVFSGKRMDHVHKESLVVSATPLHRGTVSNLKVKIEMRPVLAVPQCRETDTVMNG